MRKIKFISILLVLSMLLTVPAFAFSTGFTDVSEKATYAEAVSYLADAGILRGMASGRFAPNEKITVSQWATMLCRAFDTEPEGVSWQEAGANAVQTAIRSGWLEPTAISDTNGSICRGELYRTVFAAAGIPLYDATLYSLDWLSPGENALRVVKELGLCAENKTAAELVTRAEAAQLLHAVLTQTLTVVPPDTPVTVENLTQWNVNAFLLELQKDSTADPRRFQRKWLDVRDRHGVPHSSQPQARRELHRRGGIHREADLRFRGQRDSARIRTLS